MNRELLLERLQRYGAKYPEELEQVRAIEVLIRENRDCFERTRVAGHVTGSSWIVDERGERTLLTHHRKLNRWLQLGGHCDGDEDVLRVALKEAEEESGLTSLQAVSDEIFDIDVHPIPARGAEPEHLHYDIRFLLLQKGRAECVVSEESLDLKWFTYSDLNFMPLDHSVRRMALKWVERSNR